MLLCQKRKKKKNAADLTYDRPEGRAECSSYWFNHDEVGRNLTTKGTGLSPQQYRLMQSQQALKILEGKHIRSISSELCPHDPHHKTILNEHLVPVSNCEGLTVKEKFQILSRVCDQDKAF